MHIYTKLGQDFKVNTGPNNGTGTIGNGTFSISYLVLTYMLCPRSVMDAVHSLAAWQKVVPKA